MQKALEEESSILIKHSQTQIQQMLDEEVQLLQGTLTDYANWDELYEHTSLKPFEAKWFEDNVGREMAKNTRIAFVAYHLGQFSVPHKKQFLWIRSGAETVFNPPRPLSFSASVHPMIRQALQLKPQQKNPPAGLVEIQGQFYWIAFSPIFSKHNVSFTSAESFPLLSFGRALDTAWLNRIKTLYQIKDLSISLRPQKDRRAHLALLSYQGEVLGYLNWNPLVLNQGLFYALLTRLEIAFSLFIGLLLFSLIRLYQKVQSYQVRKDQDSFEKQRKLNQIEALYALTELRSVTPNISIQHFIEKVLDTLAHTLEIKRTSFWQFSADHNLLICLDQSIEGLHSLGPTVGKKGHEAYFEKMLSSPCVLPISNVFEDPITQGFETYCATHQIISLLDISIWVENLPFGTVCLEHIGTPRVWTPDEIAFAQTCVEWIALRYAASPRQLSSHAFIEPHSLDPLTQLPTREVLFCRLEKALAEQQGEPLALFFVGISGLTYINSQHGRATGDTLLCQIAEILNNLCRDNDLCARLESNRFALLIKGRNALDLASEILDPLIAELGRPRHVSGHTLSIHVYVGAELFGRDASTADSLFEHADFALHQAKRKGQNGFVFFSQELNAQAQRHYRLSLDLQESLSQKQLRLHYQPLVETKTGKIIGAEALLRWQHPILGLLSPDQFLPLAEQIGFIGEMGEWVLETAFVEMERWKKEGWELTMSVNISPSQLQDDHLLERLVQLLSRSFLKGAALELELTENLFIDPSPPLLQRLAHIRELGVRLAIDDFGSGYASFSYLKHLPVDTLKIDRSFLDGIPEDTQSANLVKMIVSMAQGMKLDLVAEGVELEEQRLFLEHLGCERAQGYLFSRPVSMSVLMKKIAHQTQTG